MGFKNCTRVSELVAISLSWEFLNKVYKNDLESPAVLGLLLVSYYDSYEKTYVCVLKIIIVQGKKRWLWLFQLAMHNTLATASLDTFMCPIFGVLTIKFLLLSTKLHAWTWVSHSALPLLDAFFRSKALYISWQIRIFLQWRKINLQKLISRKMIGVFNHI